MTIQEARAIAKKLDVDHKDFMANCARHATPSRPYRRGLDRCKKCGKKFARYEHHIEGVTSALLILQMVTYASLPPAGARITNIQMPQPFF